MVGPYGRAGRGAAAGAGAGARGGRGVRERDRVTVNYCELVPASAALLDRSQLRRRVLLWPCEWGVRRNAK